VYVLSYFFHEGGSMNEGFDLATRMQGRQHR
jgi:hypothetical protein